MKPMLSIALLSAALTAGATEPVNGNVAVMESAGECVIHVAREEIEYGVMTNWQLQKTDKPGVLTPGERTVPVTVTCAHSQPFNLRLSGERNARGQLRYGRYGWMRVQITNLHLDGKSVSFALRGGQGDNRQLVFGSAVLHEDSIITPWMDGHAARGRTMAFEIVLEPRVAEGNSSVSAPDVSEGSIRLTLE